jgi:hypothetical protein
MDTWMTKDLNKVQLSFFFLPSIEMSLSTNFIDFRRRDVRQNVGVGQFGRQSVFGDGLFVLASML